MGRPSNPNPCPEHGPWTGSYTINKVKRGCCAPCKARLELEKQQRYRDESKARGECYRCKNKLHNGEELTTQGEAHQACATSAHAKRMKDLKGKCLTCRVADAGPDSTWYCLPCREAAQFERGFKIGIGLCAVLYCTAAPVEGIQMCQKHREGDGKASNNTPLRLYSTFPNLC